MTDPLLCRMDPRTRVEVALRLRDRHVRVQIADRFAAHGLGRVVAGVLVAVTAAPNGGCAETVVIRTPGDRVDTAISLATVARIELSTATR